jgi:catechol 2,3-dioxygenase-like lactoylglutathione lyase family enzyme
VTTKISYMIRFVADMSEAIRFYQDILGFTLKFQSPDWSEFDTGETSLALHSASTANPAGSIRMGLRVPDLQAFSEELTQKGFQFTQRPTNDHAAMVARFIDFDGQECSVSQG